MKILIASGNEHKVGEISSIFDQNYSHIKYDTLIGKDIPDPEEPFDTFIDNAKLKAKYYADKTGMTSLSEDAGLFPRNSR